MKIVYNPKLTDGWGTIPGVQVAYAALLPDDHSNTKKWPWVLSCHGIGERSGGTTEHLENLVLGSKQPDGSRKWPYVSDDMKKAIDQYKISMIIVTYEGGAFFDANRTDWVYKEVIARFSLMPEYWFDGFSYGGGAALNAATNSLTADKIIFATPCSPTRSIGNIGLVAQNKTVVHLYVNNRDDNGSTNLSVTKGIVTDINKTNPQIPVVYTAFDQFGHSGSHEKAMALTPPKAPGGEGFTDAAENNYEYFLDIIKNGPRQMKSGAIQPIPIPEPEPPAPTILKAEFNISDRQVVTTPVLDLDASASTGVYSGWDAYVWDVRVIKGSAPKSYDVRPESVYDNDAKNKLTNIVDGEYSITLTVKDSNGNKASKTVIIIAAVTGKIATGFNSVTDLITYSDGTTEKGTAIFSGGNWVVKNATGTVINL